MNDGARAPRLLEPHVEGRVFWRLRAAMVRNTLQQALSESRFRVLLVALLTAIFWWGLFVVASEGFHFLLGAIPQEPTRQEIVRAMFSVFFVSLLVMLLFSSGIILFGLLYRSRETGFLLTLPARDERIFFHRYVEALAFSSWGFVLLGTPVLIAYGTVNDAPWLYYALIPAFVAAFVQIPAGLGAMGCLVLARWMPRARKHVLLLGGVVLAALAAWIGWSMLSGDRGSWLTAAWFQDLMARFRFAEHRLLPSWWLSTGLLEAAHGDWSQSLLFLALLTANALIVLVASLEAAGRVLRPSFDRLIGGRTARRHVGLSWIDRLVSATAFYLPPQTRLLIVKDARLYRRDPVQWSQFLIFFGLLGLYFLNVRQFRYDVHYVAWVNVIAFLNLAVVGLILATFTSRFIYPMVSLEGRRFWILGLLPLSRDTILWGKFLFGAIGATIPSLALIALSDLMLKVHPLVLALHALMCVLLCFGLAGISVGLGALMPNLREESPSKIAAGFGGTLTLVLSTLYIAVVVLLTAVPCHFYFTSHSPVSPAYASRDQVGMWLLSGLAGSCLLAVLATLAPMRMGFRAFRRLEF